MLLRTLPLLRLQPASWSLGSLTCRGMTTGVSKMDLIKDLRERTGAPISDVKAALEETKWDIGGWAVAKGRRGW